jgi:hypothetical protein
MANVRGRQRVGAEYSQGVRRQRGLEKLIKAYSDIVEEAEAVSVGKPASRAGVSRVTAYQHFAACQKICLGRCIDKKLGVATPDPNLKLRPCSTVEMGIPAIHAFDNTGRRFDFNLGDVPSNMPSGLRLSEHPSTIVDWWIPSSSNRIPV